MQCPDPGTPGGAIQVVTSYELGENVTYQCVRDGYQISDPQPKICQLVDGKAEWFNDELPVCIGMLSVIFLSALVIIGEPCLILKYRHIV